MTMDWNPTGRVSFGVSDDAIDVLDEIADREGVSRSEKLRELVKREVQRKRDLGNSNLDLPEDPLLAEAYKTLHKEAHCTHRSNPRLRLETVKSDLYTNEIPKDEVLRKIIKPLESRGYVTVTNGLHFVWVKVRDITEKQRTEAVA